VVNRSLSLDLNRRYANTASKLGLRRGDVRACLLEHPGPPTWFGLADLLSHLEGDHQPGLERLDHPGGHLWGGVAVAGTDAAAALELPVTAALVAHQLIDYPRRDAGVFQPG
jgi:hypothetical protein